MSRNTEQVVLLSREEVVAMAVKEVASVDFMLDRARCWLGGGEFMSSAEPSLPTLAYFFHDAMAAIERVKGLAGLLNRNPMTLEQDARDLLAEAVHQINLERAQEAQYVVPF